MTRTESFKWCIIHSVSKFIVKNIFRYKLNFTNTIDLDKQMIILGNHTCFIDFIYILASIGPRAVRFVIAEKYFMNPVFNFVFKRIGAIPKKLGILDMQCMSQILSALKRGENIALYPEGRIGMWGATEPIVKTTIKLAKVSNADLVIFLNTGAFFMFPPYGDKMQLGYSESNLTCITNSEMKSSNLEDLTERALNMLYVNQFEWKSSNNIKYARKNRFKNPENLVYRCVHCNELFSFEAKKDCSCAKCKNCGVELSIKEGELFFSKETPIKNMYDLYVHYLTYEKENIVDRMNFSFYAKTIITDLSVNEKKYYKKTIVDFTKDAVTLTINEEKTVFETQKVDYIPFEVANNIQFYKDELLYEIYLENKQAPSAVSTIFESIKRNI